MINYKWTCRLWCHFAFWMPLKGNRYVEPEIHWTLPADSLLGVPGPRHDILLEFHHDGWSLHAVYVCRLDCSSSSTLFAVSPDSQISFQTSWRVNDLYRFLRIPASSPEREFLAAWLVGIAEIDTQMALHYWFVFGSRESLLKSKSLKANELSWSRFNNIPGILGEEEAKESSDNLEIEAVDPAPVLVTDVNIDPLRTPPTPLNFGPHLRLGQQEWQMPSSVTAISPTASSGHTVKLHDTFMGFASSQFNLEAYADSSPHATKSFFDLSNNSKLSQQMHQNGEEFRCLSTC